MSLKSDKRKTRRIECDIPVEVETVTGKLQDNVVIKNCSVNGLCFRGPATELSMKGQEIFLTFVVPGSEQVVKVLGWVVHQTQCEDTVDTGVTFMFLSQEYEMLLEQFAEFA
ncbi:MAG: PilZ domain-containing protein [Desulfobulbaceae bacterium]|nr:MAG: PilZ domain-containing protein [Desulfobulbaceae bacterium]